MSFMVEKMISHLLDWIFQQQPWHQIPRIWAKIPSTFDGLSFDFAFTGIFSLNDLHFYRQKPKKPSLHLNSINFTPVMWAATESLGLGTISKKSFSLYTGRCIDFLLDHLNTIFNLYMSHRLTQHTIIFWIFSCSNQWLSDCFIFFFELKIKF
jgi:hypothetical protein